jgi:hypothetical protein
MNDDARFVVDGSTNTRKGEGNSSDGTATAHARPAEGVPVWSCRRDQLAEAFDLLTREEWRLLGLGVRADARVRGYAGGPGLIKALHADHPAGDEDLLGHLDENCRRDDIRRLPCIDGLPCSRSAAQRAACARMRHPLYGIEDTEPLMKLSLSGPGSLLEDLLADRNLLAGGQDEDVVTLDLELLAESHLPLLQALIAAAYMVVPPSVHAPAERHDAVVRARHGEGDAEPRRRPTRARPAGPARRSSASAGSKASAGRCALPRG